jgi:hypothetical protein
LINVISHHVNRGSSPAEAAETVRAEFGTSIMSVAQDHWMDRGTPAMPRMCTTGCRQSLSTTWYQTPAILLFWRPAPTLERVAPEICRDPDGFDRTAFHREFNAAVVEFFEAKLRVQQ